MAGNAGFAPFARVQGSLSPQQWKAEACPVDLVLAGDSLTKQFFQTLACLLRRPDTGPQFSVSWVKPWHEKLCPFGTKHCFMGDGCATFPHLAARLCYSADYLLRFSPSDYRLQNDSILVANAAYHHGDSNALMKALGKFTGDYVQMPSPSRPVVVWAEASPQHFPLHPSGYYQGKHLNYARCAPTDREAGYAQDWRNHIADQYMAAAGIPVLRRWNATQPLWDFHVVHSGRKDRFVEPVDCTHYCLPGATVLWAVALTDLLASLITPKGTACWDRRILTPEADLFPREAPMKKFHKDKNHKKERKKG
eukprot:EG_transcript_20181